MNMYLLYQLLLACSLMVYQSFCITRSTQLEKLDRKIHKSLLSQKEFNQEFDEKSDEESNEETNEERKSLFNIRFYSFVAHHSQYPYHLAITMRDDESVLCQGAFIASNWMLTSASCFERYNTLLNSIHVVSGVLSTTDPNSIVSTISQAVYHPEFDPITGINDLALVKLEDNIQYRNHRTKTINLSENEYPIGTRCNYSSFDLHIKMKNMPVIEYKLYGWKFTLFNISKCNDSPGKSLSIFGYRCAGVDILPFYNNINLDSKLSHVGAPLVCGNTLYGIKTNNKLFTSTSQIKSWVDSVINT